MPTLNIDGVGRVKVDDSFLTLSPEEQTKAVEEIAAQAGGGVKASSPPPPPPQNTATGLAKATGTGLVQGATGLVGLPADIDTGIDSAVGWAMRKFGASEDQIPKDTHAFTNALLPGMGLLRQFAPKDVQPQLAAPGSQEILKGVEENVTGPLYQPQTRAEKFARTFGEFAPGVLIGPGGLGARAAQTAGSAIGSEAAGQATEGSWTEPYARLIGALLGGVAPTAAKRAVTPHPITDQERLAAVNALKKEGVTSLTAGQKTGNEALQYREAVLGGQKTKDMLRDAGEQYSKAAMGRLGEDATRATPEAMTKFFDKIDNAYNGVAARNNLQMDQKFGRDITTAIRDYQGMVPAGQHAGIVEEFMRDFTGVAQNNAGVMPGQQYQAWRSRLGRLARKTADPELRSVLGDMQGALDDAMERSITATGNPADAALIRETNRQYRNYKIMEPAITGAGADAAIGIVSPARLRTSTASKTGRAYQTGQGDFGELARSGEAIMKPLPNSGTGPRVQAAANAGLAGALVGGPPVAAASAAGAWMLPKVAGQALMSKNFQGYLANQLMAGGMSAKDAAKRAALLEILMGPRLFAPQREPLQVKMGPPQLPPTQ